MHKKKALVLDRDGVVNLDKGYVHLIEDFSFIDGIFELVHFANSKGYLVLIATNQAGIAYGYYSEEAFHVLTEWMLEEFSLNGCKISQVYFSPYHPKGHGKYMKDHDTRKPKPGMLLRAINDWNLDPSQCIMIGDKESDILAGIHAGFKNNILYNPAQNSSYTTEASVIVDDLRKVHEYL